MANNPKYFVSRIIISKKELNRLSKTTPVERWKEYLRRKRRQYAKDKG